MAKHWSKTAKSVVKGVLAVIVLAAVGRQIVLAVGALTARGDRLRFDPLWISAAMATYLVGLCFSGLFFGRVLNQTPNPVGYAASVRAYLISHLAKYVPGKALVVIVRAGLVVPYGARAVPAGFATLYETLVFMATGGLLAAFIFAGGERSGMPIAIGRSWKWIVPLDLIALAPGVGFLILTTPWVFPKVARLVTLPFRESVGEQSAPRITWRLLLEGMLLSMIAWSFQGLSLSAIAGGVSFTRESPVAGVNLWSNGTASTALATVAGFVIAVAPGGLGVREWVVGQSLAPTLGAERALIAGLALRLAWVATELLVAAVLLPWRPKLPEPLTT